MTIAIYVENGTGGYYNETNCDLLLKEITDKNFPIPRINETIEILEDNDEKKTNKYGNVLQEYHQYLVRDVVYWINSQSCGVSVFVIPVGRSLKQFSSPN